MLVAATGVGAGDLAGAALAGSRLGCAVLWAVVVGALIKFVQNEGIARYQLATGSTFLDGTIRAAPQWVGVGFLAYFLVWSFLVAGALMSACGVAAHAIVPLMTDPSDDKILYGVLHGLVGAVLVRVGGFALFEKVMGVAIAIMFAVVVWTAVQLLPLAEGVAAGLLVPTIPSGEGALGWTIALMGGVGGTLTVLCYGYWIRESGRTRRSDLRGVRLDLTVAYAMTAVFGLCMVIIGSTIEVPGRGATLVMNLADRLGTELGPVSRYAFLIGAWCAIASSLLGVWQSVPYLYADIVAGCRREDAAVANSRAQSRYRVFLLSLSSLPMVALWIGFARMQKTYAIVGAAFMPILAAALLWQNRGSRLGELKSGRWTQLALVIILVFFFALLCSEFL